MFKSKRLALTQLRKQRNGSVLPAQNLLTLSARKAPPVAQQAGVQRAVVGAVNEIAITGELRERRLHAFDAAFDCAAHDQLGVGGAVVGALAFFGAATEFLARGTNRGDAFAEFRLLVVNSASRCAWAACSGCSGFVRDMLAQAAGPLTGRATTHDYCVARLWIRR